MTPILKEFRAGSLRRYKRIEVNPVMVRADGTPESVRVVADPGHGFGRAARQCAMRQRYEPAQDREGHTLAGTMPPINVTFRR